jgi:type II secretory pathway component PulF
MSRRFSLGSRATWAGVIGWVLTLPILGWAVVIVPSAFLIVPRFEEIFVGCQVPIPPMTRFILDVGGGGVAAAYGLLALVPLGVLLGNRRPWCRVVAPLAFVIATWALNVLFFHSLLTPLQPLLERIG